MQNGARAQNGWQPLEQSYSLSDVQHAIQSTAHWHPYPNVADTAGLYRIPVAIRQAYIHAAEKFLPASWDSLPASLFLEFSENGNRSHYEAISFHRREQLATLVLAELFERKKRFINDIVNGIWAICEESFWGVPAHMYLQGNPHELPDVAHPVIDLFAAETAQELAWTYYLLKPELDAVSPLIAQRIQYETVRRIFIPYMQHDDWGYLGFRWRAHPQTTERVNNWNPWINSNVLAAALLLAPDSLRMRVIYKTMQSIDNFVMPYPADGGSDEGPEYWDRAAGALLDYLELLSSASNGKLHAWHQPFLHNMGRYICKMYISYPYFVNYGDADAKYHPDPALVYRFGKYTGDSLLMQFGAYLAGKEHFGETLLPYRFGVLNRALFALTILPELSSIPPREPLFRDVWLPDLQIMVARSDSGSVHSFYLAAQAGNNGKSHNHNDVGNFIVYVDGHPVLVDAGAQTYTAATFSSQRYQIWNNQSSYHNLPEINGVMQQAGKQFRVTDVHYFADAQQARLSMDIAHAYPDSAGIDRWRRTVALIRNQCVKLTDAYRLRYWKAPMIENFLTPLRPVVASDGRVYLQDTVHKQSFVLETSSREFRPVVDTIRIQDGDAVQLPSGKITRNGRMYHIWGDHLYRVRFIQQGKQMQGQVVFLITRLESKR
ncbi:heparinase II/III domain-containing protein [Thermoflavifilum thermophilum]|nr:heparinase II/III family protein [Thermoflavifilum thermophilum]